MQSSVWQSISARKLRFVTEEREQFARARSMNKHQRQVTGLSAVQQRHLTHLLHVDGIILFVLHDECSTNVLQQSPQAEQSLGCFKCDQ